MESQWSALWWFYQVIQHCGGPFPLWIKRIFSESLPNVITAVQMRKTSISCHFKICFIMCFSTIWGFNIHSHKGLNISFQLPCLHFLNELLSCRTPAKTEKHLNIFLLLKHSIIFITRTVTRTEWILVAQKASLHNTGNLKMRLIYRRRWSATQAGSEPDTSLDSHGELPTKATRQRDIKSSPP